MMSLGTCNFRIPSGKLSVCRSTSRIVQRHCCMRDAGSLYLSTGIRCLALEGSSNMFSEARSSSCRLNGLSSSLSKGRIWKVLLARQNM